MTGKYVGRQGGWIDGESVVLSRDFDLAGFLVADRVIGASVAELELESLRTKGLSQELMTQADSEDRDAARFAGRSDERPQRIRRFAQGARITRPVRDKDSIRMGVEDRRRGA